MNKQMEQLKRMLLCMGISLIVAVAFCIGIGIRDLNGEYSYMREHLENGCQSIREFVEDNSLKETVAVLKRAQTIERRMGEDAKKTINSLINALRTFLMAYFISLGILIWLFYSVPLLTSAFSVFLMWVSSMIAFGIKKELFLLEEDTRSLWSLLEYVPICIISFVFVLVIAFVTSSEIKIAPKKERTNSSRIKNTSLNSANSKPSNNLERNAETTSNVNKELDYKTEIARLNEEENRIHQTDIDHINQYDSMKDLLYKREDALRSLESNPYSQYNQELEENIQALLLQMQEELRED